ncbi:MAG: hypothetical protein EOO77_24870 [Oxalobacteraceae bacterium]|nr:MAG: hypothetical protein EOO77_24870 [Oxalobacteraceae bacterium]
MARNVNGPYGNRQTTPHRVEVRRDLSNVEILVMINWCGEDEHPGYYAHSYDNKNDVMLFSFTDENLAFQFKIRWG